MRTSIAWLASEWKPVLLADRVLLADQYSLFVEYIRYDFIDNIESTIDQH